MGSRLTERLALFRAVLVALRDHLDREDLIESLVVRHTVQGLLVRTTKSNGDEIEGCGNFTQELAISSNDLYAACLRWSKHGLANRRSVPSPPTRSANWRSLVSEPSGCTSKATRPPVGPPAPRPAGAAPAAPAGAGRCTLPGRCRCAGRRRQFGRSRKVFSRRG